MKASIFVKFLLLQIPLAIVALVVCVVGWQVRNAVKEQLHIVETSQTLIELAMSSRLFVSEMGSATKGFLLNPKDHEEAERKKKADDDNQEAIGRMKELVRDDPKIQGLLDALDVLDETKLNPAEDMVISLAAAGKSQQAFDYFTETYLPLRKEYDTTSEQLTHHLLELAKNRELGVNAGIINPVNSILIVTLIGILFFAVILFAFVRRMASSLSRMVEKLRMESAQLGSTSQRISESGSELAKSTGDQASALQQVAAASDEINAMIGRNAENAKRSRSIAESSQSAAIRGKESVEAMMAAIHDINESNSSIRQAIEKSNDEISGIVKVISEIGSKTKVINEIVFQTKLLSFNASVEAARAGEHGKGFAVVAEEVGNLAQMSGNAAKEISSLLDGSIQKVESIVLETKRSVESLVTTNRSKITAGTAIADRNTVVLNEIVANVNQLVSAVNEISTASQEQARGVAEISKSIAMLDSVTHKNSQASDEAARSGVELTQHASGLEAIVSGLATIVTGDSSPTDFREDSQARMQAALGEN